MTFRPAFDTPTTPLEALMVLEAWGGGAMTYSNAKARVIAELLSPLVTKAAKPKETKADANAIAVLKLVQKAQAEAKKATAEYIDANGISEYPCGFAWVNIKPARGPLIELMKRLELGRRDEYAGGWTIWNPSEHLTQNMYVKEAGALAFAKVLRDAGYQATAHTRMD
jgi:hypothetical protein